MREARRARQNILTLYLQMYMIINVNNDLHDFLSTLTDGKGRRSYKPRLQRPQKLYAVGGEVIADQGMGGESREVGRARNIFSGWPELHEPHIF